MSQKPIGVVLKTLAMEKNLSVIQLASLSGRSRQQVHQDFNKFSLKNDVLEMYSNAFKMSKEDILSRMEATEESKQPDSNYLLEHLASLEEQFKRLLGQLEIKDKQLEVKDQQMAGLQKTVEVLLGKYSVSEDVTCLNEEEPDYHVLNSLLTGMVA